MIYKGYNTMNETKPKSRINPFRVPWVHTLLTHYTANRELVAIWAAVTAAGNTFETFLSFQVPTGMTIRLTHFPLMKFKLYNVGGTEQYPTADIMLAMNKVNQATPNEICSIGYYRKFYDTPWADQMSKLYRDQLQVDTGYYQVLLFENETLLFMVKNSGIDIPAVCHASTTLQMDVDIIRNSDIRKARQGTTLDKID